MRWHLPFVLVALLVCAGSVASAPRAPAASQPAPKVVFNLRVSLEWQPGASDSLPADLALAGCRPADVEAQYLADLQAGLRRTAAYLYAYSEGQIALGKVTIHPGGVNWDQADLRVLANSAYRPTAFIGGIVGAPTPYISATTGLSQTVFAPGAVIMGRLWDGRGARCGAWSQPAGWRTVGHEWAHYALFLYDEYYNVDSDAEQYCTTTGLDLHAARPETSALADSLMAYHYSADKLWLGRGATPDICRGTPQERVHGVADWPAIRRFYPAVTLPDALRADLDFESSSARDLFSTTVVQPDTPPAKTTAEVRLDALAQPGLTGEAYLIRPGPNASPLRIIGQGAIAASEVRPLPFWGVQMGAKDRAAVLAQDWVSGSRFFFPKHASDAPVLDVAAPNHLAAAPSGWRPAMTITPQVMQIGKTSEVTGLSVRLEDCDHQTKQILLVYCPAGGDCEAPVQVTAGSGGVFNHTFFFPFDGKSEPPAIHGYIYARSLDSDEETVGWYQLAGGVGPALGDGFAPLADAAVETNPEPGLPRPSGDARLLYGSAQSCTSSGFSLPPGVLGIAGAPLDVQPVVAHGNGGRPWGSDPTDPPLRVRLSYNQDLLDRLGIDESRLVVLRLLPGQGVWQSVPALGRSSAQDWIAAQAQPFGGQGEIYALGYGPARVLVPLVQR